jgi:adenine-specific DNA-methyltransferase
LKAIAYKVIGFISQFEDELVKIWNKPKFVRGSHYIVTLDHLLRREKHDLLGDLFAYPGMTAQIEEWVALGMLDHAFTPKELLRQLTETDLTGAPTHPHWGYLPLDTQHFPDRELDILICFDEIDKNLDGWIIQSENYQALNTVKNKFHRRVTNAYLDPPYNTAASEIIYINKFKHSTWLEMIYDRLVLSKEFLDSSKGFIICTIDDVEQKSLSFLMEEIFKEIIGVVTIRNKPSGRPIPNGFAQSHEYALFSRINDSSSISRLERTETQLDRYKEIDKHGRYFWEMLRRLLCRLRHNRPRGDEPQPAGRRLAQVHPGRDGRPLPRGDPAAG